MTIRLIQAGLGTVGRHWLRNILPARRERIEVVALVDTDIQALQSAREYTALASERCFTDLSSALAAIPCDAVLIVTPLAAHVPLAFQALNAGKHVLLEKPFAPSLSEARQLIETAERQRRVLLINQNYRYDPAVRVISDFLRAERLGPVGVVNVDFRRYANNQSRASNRHYTFWQPLLVDMAIHHFDLMCAMLGRVPLRISCSAWNPSWSNFSDPAAATALILFPDHIVVNYRGSWVSTGQETPWGGEWRIECAAGEIRWGTRELSPQGTVCDQVVVQPWNSEPFSLALPDMSLKTGWHGSLHAFLEAIDSGKEPECSGRNNLLTLALTLAAVESATSNLPVEIATLLSEQSG